MHTPSKIPAFVLPIAILLGACGQTGPLYLPGDPSEIQTEAPAENGDNDEDKKKEDDQGA